MHSTGDVPTLSPARRRGLLIGVAVAAATIAITVVTAVTAQAATLYLDDFEDGNANGWSTTGGSWSVVTDGSKVFKQSSATASDARAVADVPGGGAGSFTFTTGKVKPNGNLGYGSVALLTKVKDANTYYYLSMRSNTLELGRRLNGTTTVLASAAFYPITNAWHNLTINTFFGDRVTGTVTNANGTVTVTAMGGVPSGYGVKVGAWTRGAAGSFDDVRIGDDRVVPTSSVSASTSPSTSPSSSPSSNPTTPPASSTPPANLSCQVTYTIATSFPGGFQAGLVIRNTGTVPTTSWRLTWTFVNGQQITNLFGGTYTQVGPNVTVDSLPWDAVIAPGATMTAVGFLATWNNVANQITGLTCVAS